MTPVAVVTTEHQKAQLIPAKAHISSACEGMHCRSKRAATTGTVLVECDGTPRRPVTTEVEPNLHQTPGWSVHRWTSNFLAASMASRSKYLLGPVRSATAASTEPSWSTITRTHTLMCPRMDRRALVGTSGITSLRRGEVATSLRAGVVVDTTETGAPPALPRARRRPGLHGDPLGAWTGGGADRGAICF